MFYSMAGYFFDSIFSNVTSYLVPLVFTLSFLVTPKADPQEKILSVFWYCFFHESFV